MEGRGGVCGSLLSTLPAAGEAGWLWELVVDSVGCVAGHLKRNALLDLFFLGIS